MHTIFPTHKMMGHSHSVTNAVMSAILMQDEKQAITEDYIFNADNMHDDDLMKEMLDMSHVKTSLQCTEVADLSLSNFDEHQNDTNSHDNIADNISHFVSSGSTVPCQGIQHDQVQILLSSSEIYYAAIRGIALLHWKFDNNKKTWHTLNCMGVNNASFHDGNNCIPCHNIQNNI